MGIFLVIIAVLIGLTAALNLIINFVLVSGSKLANNTTAEGEQVEKNNELKEKAKAKLKKNAIILVVAIILFVIGHFFVGYN